MDSNAAQIQNSSFKGRIKILAILFIVLFLAVGFLIVFNFYLDERLNRRLTNQSLKVVPTITSSLSKNAEEPVNDQGVSNGVLLILTGEVVSSAYPYVDFIVNHVETQKPLDGRRKVVDNPENNSLKGKKLKIKIEDKSDKTSLMMTQALMEAFEKNKEYESIFKMAKSIQVIISNPQSVTSESAVIIPDKVVLSQ